MFPSGSFRYSINRLGEKFPFGLKGECCKEELRCSEKGPARVNYVEGGLLYYVHLVGKI